MRGLAPRVTVVVPVRDEAERLAACLEAVADQDLAPELVEVLVVDGGSADGTVEMARRLLAGRSWGRAEVLASTPGDRSSNLNCGLAHASTPVVVRVDARSRIPAHYLRRCLELLDGRPEVAVVGGRQRAVAAGGRAVDFGVARALNNRWGMGFARCRGAASGPADTVYLGAYRTADLRAVGGWRTDLAVNEDFDLNRRLAGHGTVWFDAHLAVDYVPRSSLGALLRQYWAFGLGKARYWHISGDRPRPRQVVLLAAPVAAAGGLAGLWLGLGVAPVWPVLLGAVAGAGVEAAGSSGPRGGLLGHAAGVAAMACAAGGWVGGVAFGTATAAWSGASAKLRPSSAQPAGGRP